MNALASLLSQKVVETIIRNILVASGTSVIGTGLATGQQWQDVSGALLVLFSFGWSVVNAMLAHQNAKVVKVVADNQGTTPDQVRKDLGLT